jgi:hypothetical protein
MLGFSKGKIIALIIIVVAYNYIGFNGSEDKAKTAKENVIKTSDKVKDFVVEKASKLDIEEIKQNVYESFLSVQKLIGESEAERISKSELREKRLALEKELAKLKAENIINISKVYRDQVVNLEVDINKLSSRKIVKKEDVENLYKELKKVLAARTAAIKKEAQKE